MEEYRFKPLQGVYNYKTGEYEFITGLTDVPEDKLMEFIPQNAPVQNIYGVYREMGKTPLEAMLETLTRVIEAGKK